MKRLVRDAINTSICFLSTSALLGKEAIFPCKSAKGNLEGIVLVLAISVSTRSYVRIKMVFFKEGLVQRKRAATP